MTAMTDEKISLNYIKILAYVSVLAAGFGVVIYFFKQPTAALFDLLNDGKAIFHSSVPVHFLYGSIHKTYETVIKDILLSIISIKIYDVASYDGLLIFKAIISTFFIIFTIRWINPAIGSYKKIFLRGLFFFLVCHIFMDINHLAAGAILMVILKYYVYVESPNEKKAYFYLAFILLSYLLALTDARFYFVGLLIFIIGAYPMTRLIKGVSLWPILTLIASVVTSCLNPFGHKLLLYPFMSIRAWLYDDVFTSFIPSKILSLQGIFIVFLVVMLKTLLRYNDADKSLFSKVMISLFGVLLLLLSKDLLWLSTILSFPLMLDYFYILEGIWPEQTLKSVQKGNGTVDSSMKKAQHDKSMNLLCTVFLCILPALIYMTILALRFDAYYYKDTAYFPIACSGFLSSEGRKLQVLTDEKTGSFVRFLGNDTYFDDRYELYTRHFCESHEVLPEYISFESDPDFDINGFIEKYAFDYMVLSSDSRPFMYLKGSSKYTEVYKGIGYSVFERVR